MPIQAELVLQLMMSLIEVAFLGAQQLCLGSLFQRIPLGIRPGCSSALQLLAALGMVIRSSVMGCWSPDVVPAVAAAPSVLLCGFCCRNPAGEAAGSSCFSDLEGVWLCWRLLMTRGHGRILLTQFTGTWLRPREV